MSTLFVDTINEKTSGNGVAIPGHVVQVVKTEGSGIIYFGGSYTAYTDLMTANITPKFNNSLIVVQMFQTLNTTSGYWSMRIIRDGTQVISNSEGAVATGRMQSVALKTDTPNTTSQVTYKLQGIAGGGGTDSNLYTVNNPTGSGIILMEIAQ